MIRYVDGDLLRATEDIIAHQVNGLGVMGAGLAKSIKAKHPAVFTQYATFTRTFDRPEDALGVNYMVTTSGQPVYTYDKTGHIIANLYGQARVGRATQQTDVDALMTALAHLKAYAKSNDLSVALPYKIGCALGGADWSVVEPLIADIFSDHDVTLYRLK